MQLSNLGEKNSHLNFMKTSSKFEPLYLEYLHTDFSEIHTSYVILGVLYNGIVRFSENSNGLSKSIRIFKRQKTDVRRPKTDKNPNPVFEIPKLRKLRSFEGLRQNLNSYKSETLQQIFMKFGYNMYFWVFFRVM